MSPHGGGGDGSAVTSPGGGGTAPAPFPRPLATHAPVPPVRENGRGLDPSGHLAF